MPSFPRYLQCPCEASRPSSDIPEWERLFLGSLRHLVLQLQWHLNTCNGLLWITPLFSASIHQQILQVAHSTLNYKKQEPFKWVAQSQVEQTNLHKDISKPQEKHNLRKLHHGNGHGHVFYLRQVLMDAHLAQFLFSTGISSNSSFQPQTTSYRKDEQDNKQPRISYIK